MAKVMMLQARKKTKNLYQEKENENKMLELEKQFYWIKYFQVTTKIFSSSKEYFLHSVIKMANDDVSR